MADSAIGVTISADVTDLQTKLALAQASFRDFSKETRSLADQIVAGGNAAKAQFTPALQAAATGAAQAKTEIAALNAL
jgi:hypothetical protein